MKHNNQLKLQSLEPNMLSAHNNDKTQQSVETPKSRTQRFGCSVCTITTIETPKSKFKRFGNPKPKGI